MTSSPADGFMACVYCVAPTEVGDSPKRKSNYVLNKIHKILQIFIVCVCAVMFLASCCVYLLSSVAVRYVCLHCTALRCVALCCVTLS